MSAWNCEPIIPTFTGPSAMAAPIEMDLLRGPAAQILKLGLGRRRVVAAHILLEDAVSLVLQIVVNAHF